jgi:hypothetical protein
LFFLLGIALLPFESTPLRLSGGWNAVSYLPFSLSFFLLILGGHSLSLVVIFLKSLFANKAQLCFLFLFLTSLASYSLYGLPSFMVALEEGVKIVLCLMMSFLLFYFYTLRRKPYSSLLNIVSLSYSISLFIGILARSGFSIPFFTHQRGGLDILGEGKLAFTFTEPSFVSFHLIGVVFFLLLVGVKHYMMDSAACRRLSIVLFTFALFVIISASSLRFIYDALLLLSVFILINIRQIVRPLMVFFLKFRITLTNLFLVFASCVLSIIILQQMGDPQSGFSLLIERANQVDTDPSSQIRLMRVSIPINALLEDPYSFLFGSGFSNICKFTQGLPGASDFLSISTFEEYQDLLADNCIRLSYSLHVTLLASFGLLGYLSLLLAFFNRRLVLELAIVAIISIQFDSLASYALAIYFWLLVSDVMDAKKLLQNISILHKGTSNNRTIQGRALT